MDRVYRQDEHPATEIHFAAIAIKEINPAQRHIGILHRRGDSSKIEFLHLAWHYELRNEPPRRGYFWGDPRVPVPRLRQVAARCRQIVRNNPAGIPYAFSPASECFDPETGKFLLGPTRHGLTCATFVLAVFQSIGLELLRSETWPTSRPGDREWQESVISVLEQYSSAPLEHIEALRDELGAVRIRSEEVAAAAIAPNIPAEFASVADRANQILRQIALE